MNVFIDLGCHNGDTILQFRNWRYLHYGAEVEWMMYGFDPNPNFKEDWERHEREDTKFFQKAAWIGNGQLMLSMYEFDESNSVMPQKVGFEDNKKIKVPCFDFSAWLRRFRGDHVLLKMDCEGAELPIMTKMLEDGTDDIPFLTMVEWHDGKMPTYDSNKGEIWNKWRGRLVEWR